MAALLLFLCMGTPPCSAMPAAQQATHNNSGLNQLFDPDLGEFAVDLGGFIPFSAYDHPDHYWVEQLGCGPLRQILLDHVTDLEALDQALQYCSGGTSIFPPDIQFEGEQDQATWWNSDPTYLHVWKFRINGGPVLITLRNGTPPDPVHVLVYNTAAHISDFGTTDSNDLDFEDGFVNPSWPWSFDNGGRPNLFPSEQAVERGDLVVIVKENVSQDFWTALLRSQDAEHFVRNEFLDSYLVTPMQMGGSYLDGASWGGQVSLMFALLQSAVYSGAMSSFAHDIGYHLPGVGDWDRLNSHRRAGVGLLEPSRVHSDSLTKDFFLLVDMLGCRFDDPDRDFGMQPWDLASFSLNHRAPGELRIPVISKIADEELFIHPDWQREDGRDRSNLHTQYIRNLEHGGIAGVATGFNEYFPFEGDEWLQLLNASHGTDEHNVELVPTRHPPHGERAYPDPYSHTLRHLPHNHRYGSPMLETLKLNTESKGPEAVGQGVWLGNHDTMLAGDVDGDGNIEVVFGNFEGFLHVLELDFSSGAARLIDEWRSPNLGWGLWASTAGPIDDGRTMIFGDNLGQFHCLEANGSDDYDMPHRSGFSSDAMRDLMGGNVVSVHQADFLTGNSGEELFALNQWLDWVLLGSDGQHLGTLSRGTSAVGPGICTPADIEEDGQSELLVPALDGGLWSIGHDGAELSVQRLLATNRALYRVEKAGLSDTSPCPNYLVMMGRNDDLPSGQENVYMLVRMDPTPEVVFELTAASTLDRPAFAWMHEASEDNRSFFAGNRNIVERVRVDGVGMVCECTAEMPTLFRIDGELVGADIASIQYVPTGENTGYVFVSTGSGRVYVLDQDLNFLYTSPDEWAGDPDAPSNVREFPWYSNRTVGHVFGSDLHQRPFDGSEDAGEASFYWAEYTQPMWRKGPVRAYRVGRIGLQENGEGEWDALSPFTAPLVAERRQLARTFIYQDVLPDANDEPEAYFLAEAGAVFLDGSEVRKFSNRGLDLSIFPGAIGGHVFEFFANVNYAVLDGFSVPRSGDHYDSGRTEDWWYPKIGMNRLGGQIANHSQAVSSLYDGTSMAVAALLDPSEAEGATPTQHIVTGTYGGYVFAIRPGADSSSASNSVPSTLSYASEDLGTRIIGLDTGDLDGDGVDEIVVGNWVDSGGYRDWQHHDDDRNRGHLLILGAEAPAHSSETGRLVVRADADCRDLMDSAGLASGVFGVKIDDVNGDGVPEIWAGDALGRVYLFHQHGGGHWSAFFVSKEIGAYAGMYNGLFPVKDAQGRTVRLVVQTSGYVYAFDVRHDLLPYDDEHDDDDDDDDDDEHDDDEGEDDH